MFTVSGAKETLVSSTMTPQRDRCRSGSTKTSKTRHKRTHPRILDSSVRAWLWRFFDLAINFFRESPNSSSSIHLMPPSQLRHPGDTPDQSIFNKDPSISPRIVCPLLAFRFSLLALTDSQLCLCHQNHINPSWPLEPQAIKSGSQRLHDQTPTDYIRFPKSL